MHDSVDALTTAQTVSRWRSAIRAAREVWLNVLESSTACHAVYQAALSACVPRSDSCSAFGEVSVTTASTRRSAVLVSCVKWNVNWTHPAGPSKTAASTTIWSLESLVPSTSACRWHQDVFSRWRVSKPPLHSTRAVLSEYERNDLLLLWLGGQQHWWEVIYNANPNPEFYS
jgi:hypothetical protein